MRIILTTLLVVSAVWLSGCGTPYQREGLTGGFNDYKLQQDVYRITFRGNALIDLETVQDYTLLRAAELTSENGYRYFIVLEGGSRLKHHTVTTPASATTYGTFSPYGGHYHGYTQFHGGQTYHFEKPRVNLVIRCLKEKPKESAQLVYNAAEVAFGVRTRYGIKQPPISFVGPSLDSMELDSIKTETLAPPPDNLTDEEKLMWEHIFAPDQSIIELTEEEAAFLHRVVTADTNAE